jgi:RNA polymerase sigma-70 factor (ECF subfamily)
MRPSPGTGSSTSLLGRLQQNATDETAWTEFVGRYAPVIRRWCAHWHLQEADAEDVTQTVLLKMAQKMCTFRHDRSRSFRAYLKKLAHDAWCDLLESRRRAGAGSGDTGWLDRLHSIEARDDLVLRLEEGFDQELLGMASEQVRQRVQPHTWEAFRLTVLEGQSGAEAAAQLGMLVGTVYKAKSKVQKMLQEEIRKLEGDAHE